MSINLVGTNYARNVVGAASPYSGQARATWLSWFQVTDVTQSNRGIFGIDENADIGPPAVNLYQLMHAFAPGGAGILRAVCNAAASPGNNTIWTRNAAIAAGLYSFCTVYDGTQPAGAANRWRIYLNGVDDAANGAYTGPAPGVTLIATAAGELDAGSWLQPTTTTQGDYIGCLCSCAGWRGAAASAAQVAAIHALGAGGDLSLSPLGTPRNWYRFQNNLLDSGTVPLNLTQQGAPAIAFGCPGGDPSCGGGVTTTPEDADFYLKVRRRAS